MKYKLHLILWVLISSLTYAQHSFDFKCLDDTFRYLPPGGWADYHFYLENTGTLKDSYELRILRIESVPGWDVQICARGRCVGPGIPLRLSLLPQEFDTTIIAHIFTNQNQGREKATVYCRSLADTTLKREISLYAQVGSAIEEGRGKTQVAFKGWRQLASAYRHSLFSVTGRLVAKEEIANLPKGVYLIPQEKRKILVIY